MKQLVSLSMKLVRCICGHEHTCSARMSNIERARKAARSRPRMTDGKIEKRGASEAGRAHNPVLVGSTPIPATADVAQLGEPTIRNREGVGSTPTVGSDVGRSSTVEHADVARETRVQLPPTTPNPDSSNGRTGDFESSNRGSSPRSGAKHGCVQHRKHEPSCEYCNL
jgi:hypothetical protein